MLAKLSRIVASTACAALLFGANATVFAQGTPTVEVDAVGGIQSVSVPAASGSSPTIGTVFVGRGDPSDTAKVGDREIAGVACQTIYNWPGRLFRGYFPLEVRLMNQNEDSVVIDLTAETPWGEEDSVTRRLVLTPGQVAEFEMLLRARGNGMNEYRLKLEVGTDEAYMSDCGPAGRFGGGSLIQNLMVVSAKEQPDETSQKKLTESWTKLDARTAWSSLAGRFLVSARTFDQLSTSWQAYTSLDSVILDLDEGELPSLELLEALAAWTRAGGTLIVLGVPSSSVASFPSLGSAIDERFESPPAIRNTQGDEGTQHCHLVFEEKGLVSYRFGFGTLISVRDGSATLDALVTDGDGLSLAYVAARADVPEAWIRESRPRMGWSVQAAIEDTLAKFGDLPLRSLMALMVIFALLLGPVNFMWVKRKKKPMLLLVSVPVISLACSVVLLLYGVLAQGLDIRGITRTWAVLDQRNQTGTSSEVRRVFAGRSPGEGLRPQVGTLVMPASNKWYGSHRQESMFLSDSTDGLVLSGDYFPVRHAFLQTIISDRTSRLRLDAKTVGDGIEVTNALGTNIESLLLRGPNGEYHALDGSLAQGQSALLVPTGGQQHLKGVQFELSRFGAEDRRGLMLGTYIAKLEEATLRDDCGVEVDEIDGRHFLLGILDTNGGSF